MAKLKESKIPFIKRNLWEYHNRGNYIIVTTNGIVKKNGCAVMGGGIALEAKERFPDLPKKLGELLVTRWNQLFVFPEYRLVTLPTKDHFKDDSDIKLIKTGLKELHEFMFNHDECAIEKIYSPLLGCGLGNLSWEEVSKEIYLDFLKFNGRLVFVTNK